jgi:hypothetical protein
MSIQYSPDGTSLIGPNGAVSLYESIAFGKLLTIRDAQLQTDKENAQNLANYNVTLANLQANVKASGIPQPPPLKPQMKVIDDYGVESHVPFVPPLADLVEPAPTDPGNVIHGMVNSGAVLPPDRNAIMQNQVDAIFRKTFPSA